MWSLSAGCPASRIQLLYSQFIFYLLFNLAFIRFPLVFTLFLLSLGLFVHVSPHFDSVLCYCVIFSLLVDANKPCANRRFVVVNLVLVHP